MARSLTIKHEETATTSPLFTGFLLLAMGWLALTALAGFASESNAAAPADTIPPIVQE